MSEFDKYIVQGEPDKKAKANAWQTAIGLQDVDGLKTSEYLIKTAVQHIEGDITISQVKDMLDDYYQVRGNREDIEKERADEADKVSARITEILLEKTFSFTPDFLLRIHQRLSKESISMPEPIELSTSVKKSGYLAVTQSCTQAMICFAKH